MKVTMKLWVLMAGQYDIVKGARIAFHLDEEKGLYMASCEGRTFGIAKSMMEGDSEDLWRLGNDFSGVVLHVDHEKRLMEVKVAARKEAAVKCAKKT